MRTGSSVARRGKSSARKGQKTAAGSSGKNMRSALNVKPKLAKTCSVKLLFSTINLQGGHTAALTDVRSVLSQSSVAGLVRKTFGREKNKTPPAQRTTSMLLSTARTTRSLRPTRMILCQGPTSKSRLSKSLSKRLRRRPTHHGSTSARCLLKETTISTSTSISTLNSACPPMQISKDAMSSSMSSSLLISSEDLLQRPLVVVAGAHLLSHQAVAVVVHLLSHPAVAAVAGAHLPSQEAVVVERHQQATKMTMVMSTMTRMMDTTTKRMTGTRSMASTLSMTSLPREPNTGADTLAKTTC